FERVRVVSAAHHSLFLTVPHDHHDHTASEAQQPYASLRILSRRAATYRLGPQPSAVGAGSVGERASRRAVSRRAAPRGSPSASGARAAWPRHRHGDELALGERPEPHRALGSVGIAFEACRGLPLGGLGEPLGRALGAREVGDPLVERQREPRDAARGQERPHALADLRLVTHSRAPGLPRCAQARRSASGSALTTWAGPIHARRAMPRPSSRLSRFSSQWVSVEIATETPSSVARRAWTSLRSSRSGDALISTALPCARAAANTASRSTSY